MEIDIIREKVLNGEYEFRVHALKRANLRDINPLDVKQAVLTGEVIEDYPNDPRGPSCLVCGKGRDGDYLHVVCGLSHERIWIITVYHPDIKEWLEYRTRRR
jgi:hypothetical protein